MLEADEARKSNLILEAQLLREQARADEAVVKFADAALSHITLRLYCKRCGKLNTPMNSKRGGIR